MIKEIKLPLIKRKRVAKNTIEIRLGLENENFSYLPGQYITIRLEQKIKDGKGSLRAFSLSSSPTNKEYLSTCFRIGDKPSLFKELIKNMGLGTKLIVRGPLGKFTLDEKEKRDIIMIAGGVGITPFFGMINYLVDKKSSQKVTLIYTNRDEETRPYKKELEKISKENKNIKIINRIKRVNESYLKKFTKEKETVFYICGTSQMVLDVTRFLTNLGVNLDKIKFEKFSGY